MPEYTLAIVDERNGTLLVDAEDETIAATVRSDLDWLGEPEGFGCARPASVPFIPTVTEPHGPGARIGGVWHDSLVEGPGRRSVVRFQGCPIRCKGCWVPETWNAAGGTEVPIDVIADALLDPAFPRDGVTILGGEPFAQPAALHCLVAELRGRQPDLHILVYSGHTLEALRRMAGHVNHYSADIDAVLRMIDVLIDGPYVARLADGAGPWTGSSNQRVINMREGAFRNDHEYSS